MSVIILNLGDNYHETFAEIIVTSVSPLPMALFFVL